MLRFTLFIIAIITFTCRNSDGKKNIASSSVDTKIDSAVLLMYKLYSDCETSILENNNGKIDTIAKNISYLCLSVNIITPEIHGDTTLITIFFEPEKGYEIEDPKCNFAYSVGFVGSDNQYDFVVFGDNYYTLSSSDLIKSKPNMEFIFNKNVSKIDCIHNQLMRLLNFQK